MSLQSFAPQNFGYVQSDLLLKVIIKLASYARKIAPIAERSIRLYVGNDISSLEELANIKNADDILTMLLYHGTPIINAIVWLTHINDVNFLRFFRIENKEAIKTSDTLLIANNQVLSFVLIALTRGSVPKRSASTVPIPRILRDLKGMDTFSSEAEFSNSIADFDLSQIDCSSLLDTPLGDMDQVFLNRINLAMAGHKPLKVASDLKDYFVGEDDTNAKAVQLSNLLANLYIDQMFYKSLHPLNKSRITDNYRGFYRSSIFAIFVAMGKGEASWLRLKAHNALKPDFWVKSEDFLLFQPQYHKWDLSKLAADIGEPRSFVTSAIASQTGIIISEESAVVQPPITPGTSSSAGTKQKGKNKEDPKGLAS
jgi:hypothetical protein